MIGILLFILLLNVVSIVLMYYCLGDIDKKEKLIFIAAGTAIMYVLISFIYWISTKSIEITQVSEQSKNLITFLFVPINGILILPLFAKSYTKYKYGSLNKTVFTKRGIVLGVILLIILIIECIYFKNIQEQIVNMITENIKQEQAETQENSLITNSTDISNEVSDKNDISNKVNVQNEVYTESTNTVNETNIIEENIVTNANEINVVVE